MDIKEIRGKIDTIDEEISRLIAERFALLPDVLKYKIENNLPVQDKVRESELLKNKIEKAINFGLNPEFIKELFENIMAESVKIQKEKLKS